MNEQEIWSRFKRGSETDFAYLYRTYASVMFRYGCKIKPDRDLVKDCLQQIFFNMWKGRAHLGAPVSVRNYLLKAMRTEILKKSRKEDKFETIATDYEQTVVAPYESALIEEQANESIKQRIAEMLTKLPNRQREVIFLKYYNNLSYKEIAVVMDITQESAYKLTYKALEKLQHFF